MELDLDKLKNMAGAFAHKAADGVESIAQKGKETYHKLSTENELNKAYRQLGVLYYEKMTGGAVGEAAMQQGIEQIAALRAELEDRTEPDAPQAHARFCTSCGSEVTEDAMFCPRCGEKL